MEPISIKQIVSAVNGMLLWGDENTIIESVSTDSRKSGKNALFIPLEGDTFDGHEFIRAAFDMGAVAALTHKDTDVMYEQALIRVEDTKKALAELARFYLDKFRIPVVALTGSVGKTTTKDMVSSALGEKYNVLKTQGNFNNDIGLPLTIFNIEKEHDIAVLEMGMNHFGEIHHLVSIAKPDKALITNIGMSHIENLGSREGILKSKLEIVDFFNEDNTLFINADDDMLSSVGLDCDIKTFAIDNKNATYRAENIVLNEDSVEFDVVYEDKKEHITVNLPGIHNVYNALAAFSIAKSFGVEDDLIVRGIASFSPSQMRMDIKKGEITIVNDCYNASPASVEAAMSVLCNIDAKRHIAILGDMLEMGDFAAEAHEQLGRKAAQMKIDILISVGDEAKNMNKGAIEEGMDEKNALHFENNKALLAVLDNIVCQGDAILVKASRGMKFEQIASALEELF